MHKTKELERRLLLPLDTNGDTIAHLAAEGGHTDIFKVRNTNKNFACNMYGEQGFNVHFLQYLLI